MINITAEDLVRGTGCTYGMAEKWQPYIQSACEAYQINTKRRVAAFLANVGVECDGFRRLAENLNYSADGLAATWPSRYSEVANGKRVPNAKALELHRRPEAIANDVYANRLGNGPASSGDGWRYRGHGPIQTTGKTNMANTGAAIGANLIELPHLLTTPAVGSYAAAYFWASRGCNEYADSDNFPMTVKMVNGALPRKANHGPLRESRYRDCLDGMKIENY